MPYLRNRACGSGLGWLRPMVAGLQYTLILVFGWNLTKSTLNDAMHHSSGHSLVGRRFMGCVYPNIVANPNIGTSWPGG